MINTKLKPNEWTEIGGDKFEEAIYGKFVPQDAYHDDLIQVGHFVFNDEQRWEVSSKKFTIEELERKRNDKNLLNFFGFNKENVKDIPIEGVAELLARAGEISKPVDECDGEFEDFSAALRCLKEKI